MPSASITAPLGKSVSAGTTSRRRCTKKESTQTESLKSCLSWYGVMEDIFDHQHRKKIIKTLESLFKEWLVEMCKSMNLPKRVRDNVGGKVVPYGSFNLGVDSKDADINILCVGPRIVERKDFFTSFFEKLKAQEEVKNIQVIEKALKMTYEGIEIDLVFARLRRTSVPDNVNLLDNQLLNEMDLQSVKSVNGYRVSEEILKCVPNVEDFQLALRAIRFWAKRRNISSHELGFFGGVSWAILMARVCQLFPNATASLLVLGFFSLMSQWSNNPIPVLLRAGVSGTFRGIQFWDRQTNRDVVSIITPAFPQLNTSINVTPSTFSVIKDELKRGSSIADDIRMKKASWSNLFETPNVLGKDKLKATVKSCPAQKSVESPPSEQASAPITAFKLPQAPKRQRSPSAEMSSKRPRFSEEAGPGTKVTSCEKSTTGAPKTKSPPLTGSSPSTRTPVKNTKPKEKFDAYQSLTAKLGDAPPCPATPVLVVKHGVTFQLLRASHGDVLVCCSPPPGGWPVDVSSESTCP